MEKQLNEQYFAIQHVILRLTTILPASTHIHMLHTDLMYDDQLNKYNWWSAQITEVRIDEQVMEENKYRIQLHMLPLQEGKSLNFPLRIIKFLLFALWVFNSRKCLVTNP